jgi:hypothetical protein
MTGDFWSTVTSAYWQKFHWCLEQNEEPLGDAPMNEDLTEDELQQKAAKIQLIEGVRLFFFCIVIQLANQIYFTYLADSKLLQQQTKPV